MYRIAYVSRATFAIGQGEYVLHKWMARILCDRLNRECPELSHWIESKPE